MGFFISAGLVKYKFTFVGPQLYTIGSNPLPLATAPGFMPLAVNFIQNNTTIPFDFPAGELYSILDATTNRTFFNSGNEPGSLNDGLNFPGVYAINAVPFATLLNLTTDGLLLTTSLGGDATVGDSILQITVSGYFL